MDYLPLNNENSKLANYRVVLDLEFFNNLFFLFIFWYFLFMDSLTSSTSYMYNVKHGFVNFQLNYLPLNKEAKRKELCLFLNYVFFLQGKKIFFITNNSGKTRANYVQKCQKLGFQASDVSLTI